MIQGLTDNMAANETPNSRAKLTKLSELHTVGLLEQTFTYETAPTSSSFGNRMSSPPQVLPIQLSYARVVARQIVQDFLRISKIGA